MTLKELAGVDREYLTAQQIAKVVGSDEQTIRIMARNHPEKLGFPVVCIGNRVKIPKVPFLRYFGVN